jgi:hypothetical protein
MKKNIVKIIMLGSLLTTNSFGNENSREGFIGSMGLGLGAVSSTIKGQNNTDSIGSLINLKFGYGFTPNLVGYLGGSSQAIYDDNTLNSAGLGVEYYLEDSRHSPYVSLYVGEANENIKNSNGTSEYLDGSFGELWRVGVGYEYEQWFFQLDYMNANNKKIENSGMMGTVGYNFHLFR